MSASPNGAAGTPRNAGQGGSAAIRALQAALAAEHAAVFGYGVVGARLAGAQRAVAARDWVAHETARDTLAAMLTARGARPAPAAASYDLPFTVRGPRAAISLAVLMEDRLAAAYLGLVALSDRGLRAFGAQAMRQSALRATAWSGATLAFPGIETPRAGLVPASRVSGGPSTQPEPTATPSGPVAG